MIILLNLESILFSFCPWLKMRGWGRWGLEKLTKEVQVKREMILDLLTLNYIPTTFIFPKKKVMLTALNKFNN